MSALEEAFPALMRRAILDTLAAGGHAAQNDYVLMLALEAIGVRASRDQVRSQLGWLLEQGLIRLEIRGPFHIARLDDRGRDVADGRTTVPGIDKFNSRGA